MINFSTNSNTFNPLANLKVSVKNADSKGTNSSILNSSQNTNSTQSKNSNSNEILGYKVDKDGFFTAEFNEKAGIPQDYKIHSSTMQSLVKVATSGLSRSFDSIDIAKSVGNAYKILSQVVGESVLSSKDSFTKDEIAQFPQGYEFNVQTLQVSKIYDTKDKLNNAIQGYDYDRGHKNRESISGLFRYSPNSAPATNIFDNLSGGQESGVHWATTASKYTNADGSISKGGLLIGVLNANLYIKDGETTDWGKFQGFDKSLDYQGMMQAKGNGLFFFNGLTIDEASFAPSFWGADDEFNYKDPTQMILEEIIKMQKELAQKALKKRLDTTAQANAQNSNFVKDKSQATSEILGYGVDNEGFFTSDFNEAVGLDKDYKIYAKGVENLAQELATNKHFSQIELTKTLGNVYKLFSQLVPNAQTYDKEQISQIPLGFDYDTKSLTITQKHSSQNELSKGVSANDSPLSRTQTAQSFRVNSLGKIDEIFEINSLNLGKNAYLSDGKVSKGGLFMAFAGAQLTQNQNGHIIAGNTTISGKLMGFDKNLSKGVVKDLNDFVGENGFLNSSGNTQEKFARMMKIFDLYNADLSVDEFKSQWLGLVNGTSKIDEKELKSFGEIIENFMKENGIQGKENATLSKTESTNSATNTQNSADKTQNESESAEQGFKRQIIQAKSKSPIYAQEFFAQYKNLLQDTQRLDTFNILFGASNGANGNDLNTNLTSLNLSKIKPLNKVDIKA